MQHVNSEINTNTSIIINWIGNFRNHRSPPDCPLFEIKINKKRLAVLKPFHLPPENISGPYKRGNGTRAIDGVSVVNDVYTSKPTIKRQTVDFVFVRRLGGFWNKWYQLRSIIEQSIKYYSKRRRKCAIYTDIWAYCVSIIIAIVRQRI